MKKESELFEILRASILPSYVDVEGTTSNINQAVIDLIEEKNRELDRLRKQHESR